MKKSEALKILGLSSPYTEEDIKQAHRKKIRENHPDRFTDPAKKAAAEEQTKLINEARDVLVNRRWDPEYGPRTGTGYGPYSRPYGNPYANPFAGYGNPYAQYRPGTGGGQGPFGDGDPFGGFPFDFVWTSWDGGGSRQSGQGSPFGASPFDFVWGTGSGGGGGTGTGGRSAAGSGNPFDPFSSAFTRKEGDGPEDALKKKRRNLLLMLAFVVAKLALLGAYASSAPAVGIAAYVIATAAFALIKKAVEHFRKISGCAKMVGIGFLVPVALMLGRVVIGVFGGLATFLMRMLPLAIVLAVAAVAYDAVVLRSFFKAYREARRKAGEAKP
ncbi:MAG: DnaJ domain-containing protein [Coriobacteriaceae bacterium]|nr:DnaJ domain-containing protein [Coriobacteriaceae bacterium]MDY3798958.1 DnaJ domain-containing protein [Eggerthellaceae bacterium]